MSSETMDDLSPEEKAALDGGEEEETVTPEAEEGKADPGPEEEVPPEKPEEKPEPPPEKPEEKPEPQPEAPQAEIPPVQEFVTDDIPPVYYPPPPQLIAEEMYTAEAKAQLADLDEKLENGDINQQDYRKQVDAVRVAESNAYNRNQVWVTQCEAFCGKFSQYAQEGPWRSALDGEVRRLANSPEYATKDGMAILMAAKQNVEGAFAAYLPKKTDHVPGKPGDGKPKAQRPSVPELSDFPASATDAPTEGEFTHIDKLTGEALEAALSKLSPEQLERYEAGL